MTDPGCRAFEVQPPVSVISVDGVRRALRDMNAEADIDPRAAQVSFGGGRWGKQKNQLRPRHVVKVLSLRPSLLCL